MAICGLLVAAAIAVFGQTFAFPFVAYDDNAYVYENRHVRGGLSLGEIGWAFTHIHAANWHPLTTLSHMLDCSLFGLRPWGHHLSNVALHAAATAVVFLALRRMTGAAGRSAIVAAAFCLHPLHVESVAWVSERKDVLSGLFFGLTLWCYAEYARRPFSAIRYASVLVSFALGLLCKPMLVTLPFLLLLLDYWPLRRVKSEWAVGSGRWAVGVGRWAVGVGRWAVGVGRWAVGIGRRTVEGEEAGRLPSTSLSFPRLVVEKLPLLAMAAGSCAVTYVVQLRSGAISESVPLGTRLQTAIAACTAYLAKAAWPTGLAAPYPLEKQISALATTASLAVLLAITVGVMLLARRGNFYAAVGWFWFLGMLVPVLGFVPIGDQAMADRYTYLPLIGIFIGTVWGTADLLGPPRTGWGVGAAVAVLVVWAGLSIRQAAYWQDSETLFRHALAVTHDNVLAHTNLGILLKDKGRKEEAMHCFREALAIRPTYYLALHNLGIALSEQGDWNGAIECYWASLASRPNNAVVHNNLGFALAATHHTSEARQQFEEALRLDPEYAKAENNLASVLAAQGCRDEALDHLRNAVALDGEYVQGRVNLGKAIAAQGAVDEAIAEFQAALRLQPNQLVARRELAMLYFKSGRLAAAAEQWQEVLRTQAADVEARQGLEAIRAMGNRH